MESDDHILEQDETEQPVTKRIIVALPNKTSADCHVCGLCSISFLSLQKFLEHKISHIEPGKGQPCSFCNVSFARQVAMRDHFKKKHDVLLHLPSTIMKEDKFNKKKQKISASCSDLDPTELPSMPSDSSMSDLSIANRGTLLHENTVAQNEITPPLRSVDDSIEHSEQIMVDASFLSELNVANETINTSAESITSSKGERAGHLCDVGVIVNIMEVPNNESDDVANVMYPCRSCQEIFTDEKRLKQHIPIHSAKKQHLCYDCGKSYKSYQYLSIHRRLHKKKEFQNEERKLLSSDNSAATDHQEQDKAKKVECGVCGTSVIHLNSHMKVHDLQRPYSCSFLGCTWRFNSHEMCAAHVLGHTMKFKSQFKCSKCSSGFRRKVNLQRHEVNVHKMPKVSERKKQNVDNVPEVPERENQNVDKVPEVPERENQNVDKVPEVPERDKKKVNKVPKVHDIEKQIIQPKASKRKKKNGQNMPKGSKRQKINRHIQPKELGRQKQKVRNMLEVPDREMHILPKASKRKKQNADKMPEVPERNKRNADKMTDVSLRHKIPEISEREKQDAHNIPEVPEREKQNAHNIPEVPEREKHILSNFSKRHKQIMQAAAMRQKHKIPEVPEKGKQDVPKMPGVPERMRRYVHILPKSKIIVSLDPLNPEMRTTLVVVKNEGGKHINTVFPGPRLL